MVSVLPPDAKASGAGTPFAEDNRVNTAMVKRLEEPVILERLDKHGMRRFFMRHCESNRPLAR